MIACLKPVSKYMLKGFTITTRLLVLYASVTVLLLQTPTVSGLQSAAPVYTGDPKTIAHDFLDLEKTFGAGTEHYAMIDRLINKSIAAIRTKKNYTSEDAVQTMRTIDSLLKEEGFIFKNNFLLGKGIERKAIDCDNYCALYIAIAEVLKIPIIPVYAPGHSFIRFCFDDGTYINWETTQGKTQPDSYYIKTLRIPEESMRRGVYMKSLTRKEFIAVEYNNIGAYLMSMGKFGDAIPYFNAAIQLHPVFSSAYHNRGTSCYAIKRLKEALPDLLKADSLDPSRPSTHNTLGDIYFDQKEYDKAVHEYAVSIRLDPTNHVPYNSIGLIMKIQKKDDKAKTWLKKSEEIKEKYGR
jgi:tetratricopeptide (TPR) repeat protein